MSDIACGYFTAYFFPSERGNGNRTESPAPCAMTKPKAIRTEGDKARRQSGSIEEGCAGRGRPALRLMPHRYLRRHQGGRARRGPARGISAQGAARLQIGRAFGRRPGGDGRRRLSSQRGRDRSAGALSGASVAVVPAFAGTTWSVKSAPLLLICLEVGVGDAQLRHRYLCGIGARDEIADHMVGLDRQAGPDVPEHRRGHG